MFLNWVAKLLYSFGPKTSRRLFTVISLPTAFNASWALVKVLGACASKNRFLLDQTSDRLKMQSLPDLSTATATLM